ncbi:MAG: hypothetical protein LBP35_02155 [Candidatus Ancillula trichonymphae]|nr:hypothetical protein [Candidatus Ancillula trichonymphae]
MIPRSTGSSHAKTKPYDQLPDQLYTDDFGTRCDEYGSSRTRWLSFQPWSYEYINYLAKIW